MSSTNPVTSPTSQPPSGRIEAADEGSKDLVEIRVKGVELFGAQVTLLTPRRLAIDATTEVDAVHWWLLAARYDDPARWPLSSLHRALVCLESTRYEYVWEHLARARFYIMEHERLRNFCLAECGQFASARGLLTLVGRLITKGSTYDEAMGMTLDAALDLHGGIWPGGGGDEDKLKLRWVKEERTLYWGNIPCRVFKKSRTNQEKLIQHYHDKGWPDSIWNPLGGDQTLKDTINDLNEAMGPDCPIIFEREHSKAKWRLRDGSGTGR
jgi:hypothetical protein